MPTKIVFSPGRCENPECRRFVLRRTDWLSVERTAGSGHGYNVCGLCLETTAQALAEHNFIYGTLSNLGMSSSGAVVIAAGIQDPRFQKYANQPGNMINREGAIKARAELKHNCPYCGPCPTHGY